MIVVYIQVCLYCKYSVHAFHMLSSQPLAYQVGKLVDTKLVTKMKRMAMSTHKVFGKVSPSQETWTEYVERLQFYFEANDIWDNTTSKKRVRLLNVCGTDM